MNKLYENINIQIYSDPEKTKKNNTYEYIYKYINVEKSKIKNEQINIMKSPSFPIHLISITKGFLFVHNNAEIPLLPDSDYLQYKTNLKNLSNGFIQNKNKNVIINIAPSNGCHPNCINDFNIALNINYSDDKPFDGKSVKEFKKEIFDIFMKNQNHFKNIKEWKQFIIKNCPTEIHFVDKISDSLFNKAITENDYCINYDIHDINEFEIIKLIESSFEDMNQMVKIYNNYNHIYDRIKNECDRLKIKYTTNESKNKRIKKKAEGLKYIELKYSDLLKCKIEYLLTDFIS